MDLNTLKEIISTDMSQKQCKYRSRDLYYNKNEKSVSQDYYINGEFISNNSSTKHNIQINYLKILITQKIDYILSNPVTVNDTRLDWDDVFQSMLLECSLDSVSWLYLYVNNNGLNWKVIKDSEIISISDEELIRYYRKGTYIIAEHWNLNTVTTYKISEEDSNMISHDPHYKQLEIYKGEVENIIPKSFKSLPFIPLYNNRNKECDGEDIYVVLDIYNEITNGLLDNIDSFQEAIMKLKNFTGDSEELRHTMKEMKRLKAVGLPADGDIEHLEVQIPVEAREFALTLTKNAIFSLGRGVDVDKIISAGQITNVYIKSRYQALEFKSNDSITQLTIFYKKVLNFLNSYTNTKKIPSIQFNTSLIHNIEELITTCVSAIALYDKQLISRESLMREIPWIENVEQEINRINKENLKSKGNETLPL